MRAVRCHQHGPPDGVRVEEIPEPTLAPGQVLVDIEAAAVNYPDVLLVTGGYQAAPALPFVVGGEFAGTVRAVSPDVAAFTAGQRVLGLSGYGAFAERIAVDAGTLRSVPAGIDAATAAAFTITYSTAYHALRSTACVRPGETVAVLGAAGGVGSAAVEVAKALGARVIAAASTAGKLEFCRSLGADEVVDYAREDFKACLKRLAPGGVDVVLDPVGGRHSEPALRAMGWGSRFVVVGFAAGEVPRIPLNLVLLKGVTIMGFDMASFARHQPALRQRDEQELFELLAAGRIRPRVTARYPLEQAAEALRAVADRRVVGKAVVCVSPGPG